MSAPDILPFRAVLSPFHPLTMQRWAFPSLWVRIFSSPSKPRQFPSQLRCCCWDQVSPYSRRGVVASAPAESRLHLPTESDDGVVDLFRARDGVAHVGGVVARSIFGSAEPGNPRRIDR